MDMMENPTQIDHIDPDELMEEEDVPIMNGSGK
jgi:hypothetical protein